MTARPLCIVAATGPVMDAAIARRFAREGFDFADRYTQALQRSSRCVAGPMEAIQSVWFKVVVSQW